MVNIENLTKKQCDELLNALNIVDIHVGLSTVQFELRQELKNCVFDRAWCEDTERKSKIGEMDTIIELSGYWYQNCKQNRAKESKCCQTCPFRKLIEEQEAAADV